MAIHTTSIEGRVLKLHRVSSDTEAREGNVEKIFDAAREGHLNVVRDLVEKGADFNVMNDNGDYPLHWAALNNHLGIVKYLVDKGADFNVKNKGGNTPLHWSARSGKLGIVKYLVEEGADFNVKNNEDLTCLQEAARIGHLNVVRYLVEEKHADINGKKSIHAAAQGGSLDVVKYFVDEKKANFNIKNNIGNTPLHDAAREGHLNVVKYLVEKGADLSNKNNEGNTPLYEAIAFNSGSDVIRYLIEEENNKTIFDAAKNGNLEKVKNFIEDKKIDVNVKDSDKFTPLHWAANNGHFSIVKYLVDQNNADINAREKGNGIPLHFAASNDHLDIVKYFIKEKHIDINIGGYVGNTPLHYAAISGHPNTVKWLIDNGAGVMIKNEVGNTALNDAIGFNRNSDVIKYLLEEETKNIFGAAKHGNLEKVKYFIEDKKIDVNVKDSDKFTPLHWAAKNGHFSIVKYLVDQKNADIKARENGNGIPLHFAASNDHLDIVKYFIKEKHIDINIGGYVGNTPLHYAAISGKPNTVKWLIDNGAGVTIKNEVGNTALDDAIGFNRNSDVIKYLTDAGAKRNRRSIESKDLSKDVKSVKQREINDLISIRHYYGKIPLDSAKDQDVKGDLESMNLRSVNSSETISDITHQLYNGKKSANSFRSFLFAQTNATENMIVSTEEVRASSWINGFNRQVTGAISGFKGDKQQNAADHIRNRRDNKHGDVGKEFSESITSSSTRPSSWINDLFGWGKNSISGLLGSGVASSEKVSNTTSLTLRRKNILNPTSTTPPSTRTDRKQEVISFSNEVIFQDNVDYVNANLRRARERKMPLKFESKGGNTILDIGGHYLSQIDFDGTIMLLDLLIRRIIGRKYISSTDQHMSLIEAQGCTLNITDRFEKVLNETAIKSGISVTNLNFVSIKTQLALLEQMKNGIFSEISKTLYLCAKEACPDLEQRGKFLTYLKSNLEEILAKKETRLLQQKTEQVAYQQVSRKVLATDLCKKSDPFLNGTSVVKGIINICCSGSKENLRSVAV